MTRILAVGGLVAWLALGETARAAGAEPAWRAGAAQVDITPVGAVWMSGYSARKSPSEGVTLPIRAKALALADAAGHKAVLITADLIGFNRAFSGRLTDRLRREHGLPREAVALLASHTHTGPMLADSVDRMKAYGIDPARATSNVEFTCDLEEKLVTLVGKALAAMEPATLGYGVGRAAFAMNRREKTATGFKIGVNPDGPTDQDVPVLRVAGAAGRPLAIVFGYACHNTTLTGSFLTISGDYAGFAQARIEADHPGAVALFVTGCGGDANPEPRGTLELAEAHGRALAGAVDAALAGSMLELTGRLRTAYAETTVRFAGPSDRASYERRLDEPGAGRQGHARRMIEAIDEGKPVRVEYPYPVQAFALGDRLTLLALAGEVVVDYAIRLKRELGGEGRQFWVAAYANDVFGYIPSTRVLKEGGYEGLEAFYGSTFPTPFAEDVESIVVGAARDVVEKVRGN